MRLSGTFLGARRDREFRAELERHFNFISTTTCGPA
jgi:hypothetical protein